MRERCPDCGRELDFEPHIGGLRCVPCDKLFSVSFPPSMLFPRARLAPVRTPAALPYWKERIAIPRWWLAVVCFTLGLVSALGFVLAVSK